MRGGRLSAKRRVSAKAFYIIVALIGCAVISPGTAYSQLLKNFQFPFGKNKQGNPFQQQLEQAGIQAAYNAIGKALGDNLPIQLDARTALPPVTPPVGFSPRVIACSTTNANMPLPPGDYTCQVRAYCTMDSIHRPGAGVPYELAPLRGKQAGAIATMFNRGAAADIPPQTLQTISWSIQASIPLSQMPPQHQVIVHRLIPEYERGLNGDFLQQVEATYKQFAPIAHLPPLETVLDRMGGAGQTIKSIFRSREIIRQNALHFSRLNEELYDGPPGQEVVRPPYPLPSPWSQIRPGVIAQFIVQQGNLGLNTLNFRVLGESKYGEIKTFISRVNYTTRDIDSVHIAQGVLTPAEVYLYQIIESQIIGYSQRMAAQALILAVENGTTAPLFSKSAAEDKLKNDIIKGAGLPTDGEVPYIPPKSWRPTTPLPRCNGGRGYLDDRGRCWVKPRGIGIRGVVHWDVQLPPLPEGGHINVNPDGSIPH